MPWQNLIFILDSSQLHCTVFKKEYKYSQFLTYPTYKKSDSAKISTMDSAQRTVLINNHMELARDIVTTEDFLGICYQQKLFDTNLIEIIRVSMNFIIGESKDCLLP